VLAPDDLPVAVVQIEYLSGHHGPCSHREPPPRKYCQIESSIAYAASSKSPT
jgi:hypothetical protein